MRTPARHALIAALVLALCPSCFTVWLWGGRVTTEREYDGSVDTDIERDPNDTWGHVGLAGRVILTPVFLVLDCLTFPVQAWLYDWDDDEDDDC